MFSLSGVGYAGRRMRLFSILVTTTVLLSPSANGKTLCARIQNSKFMSSKSCVKCHAKEYKAWKHSRHMVSFDNDLFQRGFKQDRNSRCLTCHIPMPEQREAFFSGELKNSLLREGVNCQGCHAKSLNNTHLLKESFFCARCHQFSFKSSNEFAQKTFNEWQEYKEAGGLKTCQNCHMPDGLHSFRGPHSVRESHTSLKISLVRKQDEIWALSLSNKLAGHHVPTGDVYRHISIEVKDRGAREFQVIALIGRNPIWRQSTKGPRLEFKNDNALKVGEVRTYSLSQQAEAVRVVYHFEAKWAGVKYWAHQDLKKKLIFHETIPSFN